MEDSKSGSRWIMLGLLCLNVFFAFVATQIVPPLFSEIKKEIDLTMAQLGMVIGVIPLASLIFAPLGGGLSDKLGARWVFAGGAILVAIAGWLRYFVDSVTTFTLCMFFIGAGIAIFTTLIPKVASTWFPPQELAKGKRYRHVFHAIRRSHRHGTCRWCPGTDLWQLARYDGCRSGSVSRCWGYMGAVLSR